MSNQSLHHVDPALLKFLHAKVPADYKLSAIYPYTLECGSNYFFVARGDSPCREKKWMRPVFHDGNKYVLKKPDEPKNGYPLFKRQGNGSEYILVVEGEKCVEIAAALGIDAVTSGASSTASNANWEFLRNRKVLIWPDYDEPGFQYAMSVYKKIKNICADVKIIDVAKLKLPAGGDIEQYLDTNPDADEKGIRTLPKLPDVQPLKFTEKNENNGNAFPVHCLPESMQRAAKDIAKEKQVTLAMAAFSLIAALSHIGMTRVNVRRPNMPSSHSGIPTSLYLLILGGSGEGKTQSLLDAFKVIYKNEKHNINQAMKKIAELKETLKAADAEEKLAIKAEIESITIPQSIFDDATFEPLVSRLLDDMPFASLISDEGGQFLGGHSMKAETFRNTLGGLTKLWDSGQVSRLRSKSNADGSGIAFNKRFMFYLMAQAITVQEALEDSILLGQGFLARFLFAAPESLVGSREIDVNLILERRKSGAYERPEMQNFWSRCEEILATKMYVNDLNENEPPALELDDLAIIFWAESWNDLEKLTAPNGKYHCIKEIASRVSDNALRLSALFALYKNQNVIDLSTYRDAYEICRYSLEEWLRYFNSYSTNSDRQQSNDAFLEVARWLIADQRSESWGAFTAKRFNTSGLHKYRAAEARNKILNKLVEHNFLFTSDGVTFIVNPRWEGQEL